MLTETADIIRYIWASEPPYEYHGEFWSFSIKEAIIPELGIGYMPKPYQQPGPPVSISLASPHSSSAALAAEKGWNMISANITPPYSVASHWRIYSETMAKLGKTPDGNSWRVARCMEVAPTDQEAKDRTFGEDGSNRYFFGYIRRVLGDGGLISVIKPRIDMTDEETTVEAVTEAAVMYGSPKTVLDKLVAFREEVGPFGTLLMTGADWSGPNRAWEQESMRLLAEEVMPRFRQHTAATAAAE
jgi:alkanesulfonate monooxygenase SsuD/methylene tetrahydromethanopterin reductase-like flavin-dependent oxidoreductase (luciferase family)